jgi:hypothetical protein
VHACMHACMHVWVRRANSADADEMRDALSEYFGLVSELCEKAFTLIRQVFPPSASLKVTRLLIDRMVNDPAFGIQVKVSEVLTAEAQTVSPPLASLAGPEGVLTLSCAAATTYVHRTPCRCRTRWTCC